jgi:hypothetical protein
MAKVAGARLALSAVLVLKQQLASTVFSEKHGIN